MNWTDIAILSILGVSVFIGIMRGLVREVLSIVVWILAFWVAIAFSPALSGLLAGLIDVPSLRSAAAFLMLLIGTLLLGAIANYLIGRLLVSTGLSGTDRMLGVLFGLARGIVIVGVIVVLAHATPLPRDPWWQQSMFLPYFDRLANIAIGWMPDAMAAHFR